MRLSVLTLLLCFGLSTDLRAQAPMGVSIVQLIANPEKFDGKPVRIIGYLHLEFEGDAIYLHREDYARAISKNALSIDFTGAQQKTFSKLNNNYVLVEGVFKSESGHMGVWSGTLQQVSRVSNWSVDRTKRPEGKRQ